MKSFPRRLNSLRTIAALFGWLAIIPITAVFASTSRIETVNDRLVESFLKHVDSLTEVSSDQKKKLATELQGRSESAISDALMSLYPDYAAAIEGAEDAGADRAIELLQPLTQADDAFLAADASFFLARTLMNEEQFENALPLLNQLVDRLATFSVYEAESHYFLGVAQAGLLQRKEAIDSLMAFLQLYPDAAERLRVSAWRQVQELQSIEAGQLPDVRQHMEFSRRRLQQQDLGQETQEKQDRIVQMLAQLIEEEEKKECNSSCKNSSQQKQQQQEKPQAPQQSQDPKQGESDTGGSSNNPNGRVVEKSYDDSPASPWSRLRDRSRDPANNAVKEKLPSRYRDIVERYFEKANEDK